MNFKLKQTNKLPKLSNPIVIEGLPGVGSVGKIVADFLIDNLKAKKVYEVYSYSFPQAVFINEDNLAYLPKVEVYYKKRKGQDLIFMTGDIQPLDEQSCYEFCDKSLDLFEKFNIKELITLGGIGLPNVPKKPKVYFTANSRKIMQSYGKRISANNELYGVVGPIIGVSGVLLGLAKERDIPAVCLMAETFAHPAHLGIKSARALLKDLDKLLKLNLNFKRLDLEIEEIEKEIALNPRAIKKVGKLLKINKKDETSYIG